MERPAFSSCVNVSSPYLSLITEHITTLAKEKRKEIEKEREEEEVVRCSTSNLSPTAPCYSLFLRRRFAWYMILSIFFCFGIMKMHIYNFFMYVLYKSKRNVCIDIMCRLKFIVCICNPCQRCMHV